ncbi:1,6-dihydroxycyclohexa-2,4-diene-1-carboxylate dehydrogenase [Mycolicibacterium porcinum]|uniref:1,6-dihydroxycyclohexa-2,4-diene-1-carboxylate dehydrogenase n=1 Tax=Mycolicibacterium porcinum TaxID=39693 RepID=UPI001197B8BA|nr:1,6-dihydroxycyclohexa-2,4-diene-1-carboxylate dehydrogenase [Mycolicibacterium porcinum]TVX98077.1 1,6-dihydroxycyclohexa-2,4-diene-1-carboxylate dehydrogenase [Mycolicibacterium porcinum]
MMRFTGKVAVVTGAAQGIGNGVARGIAAEGGTVILADRSARVTQACDEISAAGSEARAFQCDLETYYDANELMRFAVTEFGRIDILINNVGGTIWRKPYEFYEEQQILAELHRSLLPTMWCCRAALPHMIERGHGVIVNVSSNATRSINRVPYAAAKGGVNALTASLAFETAKRGIRVVATAPGGTTAPPGGIPRNPDPLTDDEMRWHEETVVQSTESTFLKRYSSIEEQVAPILFLASDDASYITGTVLEVSGGDRG